MFYFFSLQYDMDYSPSTFVTFKCELVILIMNNDFRGCFVNVMT